MSTQIVSYKEKNVVNTVEFTVPEKIKSKYFSYASRNCENDKVPVYIRTPVLTVTDILAEMDLSQKTLVFKMPLESPFVEFIRELEEHAKDVIFQNSESFFMGKRFSKSKIENSFTSVLNLAQRDYCAQTDYCSLEISVNHNACIKDQRGSKRTVDDIKIGQECILIVNLQGIAYTKTSMKFTVLAEQIKVYANEELSEWCILQDEDEKTVCEENSIEQLLSTSETENGTATAIESENNTTDQPQNDDDKNLF